MVSLNRQMHSLEERRPRALIVARNQVDESAAGPVVNASSKR